MHLCVVRSLQCHRTEVSADSSEDSFVMLLHMEDIEQEPYPTRAKKIIWDLSHNALFFLLLSPLTHIHTFDLVNQKIQILFWSIV